VLFRPPPYPEPDRLALVNLIIEGGGARCERASSDGRGRLQVRDNVTALQAGAFIRVPTGVNFVADRQAQYVREQRVSVVSSRRSA
jgi:hypothetical protein